MCESYKPVQKVLGFYEILCIIRHQSDKNIV